MGMKFRQHAEEMGVVFDHAAVEGISDAGGQKVIAIKDGDVEKTYEAGAIL